MKRLQKSDRENHARQRNMFSFTSKAQNLKQDSVADLVTFHTSSHSLPLIPTHRLLMLCPLTAPRHHDHPRHYDHPRYLDQNRDHPPGASYPPLRADLRTQLAPTEKRELNKPE